MKDPFGSHHTIRRGREDQRFPENGRRRDKQSSQQQRRFVHLLQELHDAESQTIRQYESSMQVNTHISEVP
jgi:hypothetical protein